jgi:hypothetical protein
MSRRASGNALLAPPPSERCIVAEAQAGRMMLDRRKRLSWGRWPQRVGDVGPPAKNLRFGRSDSSKEALMQYLGMGWGTRKAAWCAVDDRGVLAEGMVPADEDGLAWLVHRLGPDVRG